MVFIRINKCPNIKGDFKLQKLWSVITTTPWNHKSTIGLSILRKIKAMSVPLLYYSGFFENQELNDAWPRWKSCSSFNAGGWFIANIRQSNIHSFLENLKNRLWKCMVIYYRQNGGKDGMFLLSLSSRFD